MNSRRSIRNRLTGLRQELVDSLLEQLNKKDMVEVKRYYDQIDLLDKTGKKVLQGFEFPVRALIIGSICLLIVSLSLAIKKEDIFFKGTLYVTAAKCGISKNWSASTSIKADAISFSNISEIESPLIAAGKNGNYFVKIEGKREPVYLSDLAITNGASVGWTLLNGNLGLSISRDSLNPMVFLGKSSTVTISGDTSVIRNSSGTENVVMQLRSARAGEDPVEIGLRKVGDWSFDNMVIDRLDVMRKVSDNNDRDEFQSTMINGKISVREGGKDFDLKQGDNVRFDGLKTRRFSVQSDSSFIRIDIEGTATTIKAGPRDYESELNPTFAEFVFHESWIVFFYSSFIFLWGLLWSLHRLFFKPETNE